jgi:hypothetical protein
MDAKLMDAGTGDHVGAICIANYQTRDSAGNVTGFFGSWAAACDYAERAARNGVEMLAMGDGKGMRYVPTTRRGE